MHDKSSFRVDFTANVADNARYGIDFVAICVKDYNDGINGRD